MRIQQPFRKRLASQEKQPAFIWMLNVSCVLCLPSLWLKFPGLDFTLKYSSHIYTGQLCSSLVCVWCQSLGVTRKKGSLALHEGKNIWMVTTENRGDKQGKERKVSKRRKEHLCGIGWQALSPPDALGLPPHYDKDVPTWELKLQAISSDNVDNKYMLFFFCEG